MTRQEFLRLSAILGIGLPIQCSVLPSTLASNNDFDGKVIIIGAGVGGMSAAYLLKQQNIEFIILEASNVYGGRIKTNRDFADFPIPLGAEWIETSTDIFDEIVNNSSVKTNVETVKDAPDRKFVDSSWLDFYDTYIVPDIKEHIRFNHVVKAIEYSGDKIRVECSDEAFTCDKVIVSVPLKILQNKLIDFSPELPSDKTKAINEALIWNGFKAFIQFSEKFYDEGHMYDITPKTRGQKIYYDVCHGQNTSYNIVGLFSVGEPADEMSSLEDDKLIKRMLQELDDLYEGKASKSYIKHICQKWDKEPHIQSGYLTDHADWRTVEVLGKPIVNKVYFAGGAYTDGNDWVSVHAAARSGRRAVETILNN